MNSQREALETIKKGLEHALVKFSDGVSDATPIIQALSEIATLQAATEQGVGEAVYILLAPNGYNPGQIFSGFEDENGSLIIKESLKGEKDKYGYKRLGPFYAHPPKPTGGGVPDEWVAAMQRVIDWFDACNVEQDLICPREEYARIKALLATQQPPERGPGNNDND